jgi:alkylation response protein AidB-like acyl-CoA dehydrogenase
MNIYVFVDACIFRRTRAVMITFEPTEDQALMQSSVATFAKAAIAPRVRELEAMRGVPADVRRQAHELGLALLCTPEACGGQGQGLVTRVLVEEELGAADAGAAFGLGGPHAFATAVLELGTEAQAQAELAAFAHEDAHDRFGAVAWSEPAPNRERAGFSTVAARAPGGYVLTGRKAFVGNAELADRFVVFAEVEPERGWGGIGAFVVHRGDAGLSLGPRCRTLGLDAASFGEVVLDGVRVPEGARLAGDAGDLGFLRATLRFFAKQALVVAARAVGVSRYAFEMAREYCETRRAFGKPIGHFQAVAFTLADRLMDVESSRWLVWRAAAAWDATPGRAAAEPGPIPERAALVATAQAVANALEAAMRAADDCVGLHGGAGFIRDLPAEKLMRDAKQLALAAPTPEQLDQLAAALEIGAPLDPALVLPTPDAQAIFT